MVNAHWQNNGRNNSTDEPIFIDRDGDNFRYVLAYMRDHRVTLPMTVPVANLLADLAYYAFPEPKVSDIVSEQFVKALPFMVSLTTCSANTNSDDHLKKLDRLITKSSNQTTKLKDQKRALLTAKLIANLAMKDGWNGKGTHTVVLKSSNDKINASDGIKAIHHEDGSKLFEKYLSYFGLAYVSATNLEQWISAQDTQIVVKRTNHDDTMWSQRTLILPSGGSDEDEKTVVMTARRVLDHWFQATKDRITELRPFINNAVDVAWKWGEFGLYVFAFLLAGWVVVFGTVFAVLLFKILTMDMLPGMVQEILKF